MTESLCPPSPCAAWPNTRGPQGLNLWLSTIALTLFSLTTVFAQTAEAPYNRLYVTNYLSNNVSVVDLNLGKVTTTIPVGTGPAGMAVAPDLEEVYVANMWSGTVSVISTDTNTVTATIPIPTFNNPAVPFGLAMMPDGSRVYVTNINDGTVRVIDTKTQRVTATITAAYDWAMRYIGISPDGQFAWVIGAGDGKISIIRTADNQLVTRILNLPSARHLAFTPDGTRAYVTAEKLSRVYVIDAQKFTLLNTIQFPAGVGTVTVDICKDGQFAMVSNYYGKPSVIDIDPKSPRYNQVTVEVPPKSSYQYCIAISPDGRTAYLSNQADRGASPNSINIIELNAASSARNTIINSIPVGTYPWGIAIVKQ